MGVYDYEIQVPGTRGVPTVRIMGQLGSTGRVIYNELGRGVRNPECIWDWFVKKRTDLEESVGHITNRGIYSYFEGRIIVKTANRRILLRAISLP